MRKPLLEAPKGAQRWSRAADPDPVWIEACEKLPVDAFESPRLEARDQDALVEAVTRCWKILTKTEMALGLYVAGLFDFARGCAFPGSDHIFKELGIYKRNLWPAAEGLASKGLFIVVWGSRGKGRGTLYIPNVPKLVNARWAGRFDVGGHNAHFLRPERPLSDPQNARPAGPDLFDLAEIPLGSAPERPASAPPAGLAGSGSQPAGALDEPAPALGKKTDQGLAVGLRLLTDELVQALEHRTEAYEVEDGELAGFAVRVGARSSRSVKSWMARGKGIGNVADLTAARARELALAAGCERCGVAEPRPPAPAPAKEEAGEVVTLDNHKRLLTDEAVAAIRVASVRFFVWDTEITGLGVYVTPIGSRYPRGLKVFYLQYRIPGAGRAEPARKIKLGRFPSCSAGQARAKALQAYEKIHAGGDPARERRKGKRATRQAVATSSPAS